MVDVDDCDDADVCLGDITELPHAVLFQDGVILTSISGSRCTVPKICEVSLEAFDQMLAVDTIADQSQAEADTHANASPAEPVKSPSLAPKVRDSLI